MSEVPASNESAQKQPSKVTAMWGDALLDNGFAAIPNLLIRSQGRLNLSAREFQLIVTVLSFKTSTGFPLKPLKDIAEIIGCSGETIQTTAESLEKKAFLVRERVGDPWRSQWVWNFNGLLKRLTSDLTEQTQSDLTQPYRSELTHSTQSELTQSSTTSLDLQSSGLKPQETTACEETEFVAHAPLPAKPEGQPPASNPFVIPPGYTADGGQIIPPIVDLPDISNPAYVYHRKIAQDAFDRLAQTPSMFQIRTLMKTLKECEDCWDIDDMARLLPTVIQDAFDRKKPILSLSGFLRYKGRGAATAHPFGKALAGSRPEPKPEPITASRGGGFHHVLAQAMDPEPRPAFVSKFDREGFFGDRTGKDHNNTIGGRGKTITMTPEQKAQHTANLQAQARAIREGATP